jgi:hypothetical protein
MNLEPYHDTLKQCWHIISGFGHGEFEIQISTGKSLCITQNSTTHGPGVPLELEACLSKKTQLWVDYGTDKSRSRFELVAHPKLCIASDTKVQSGAVLYQENCNNSSPRQHWFINTSP